MTEVGEGRAPAAPAQLRALLAAWLTIDLFGKSRRSGERGTGTLTTAVFSQGFLSYVFAALCFEEAASVPFLAATLALVSGFTALAILGEVHDQVGHPADRDLVQATPISRASFLLARTIHVSLLLAIFGIGLAIAPAVLAAWKTGSIATPPIYLVLALLLSASVAASFQLPVLLATRLLGKQAGASISALVRATLFGGGVLALLLGYRAVAQGPQGFPGGRDLLVSLPPYWVARAMQGPDAWKWALSSLAFFAGAGGALFLVALLPQRADGTRRRALGRRGIDLTLRLFASSQRVRGAAAFAIAMLARDRTFRLRALPLLGLPAAAVILGLRAGIDESRLPFFLSLVHNLPLAYLPLLLFFVPYAEGYRASWVLRASVGDPVAVSRQGAALAFGVLLVPLQLLLFAVDASYRSAGQATWTSLASLGLAWTVLPRLSRELVVPAFSQDPDDLAAPSTMMPSLGVAVGIALAAMSLEAMPTLGRVIGSLFLLGLGAGRLRSFGGTR